MACQIEGYHILDQKKGSICVVVEVGFAKLTQKNGKQIVLLTSRHLGAMLHPEPKPKPVVKKILFVLSVTS